MTLYYHMPLLSTVIAYPILFALLILPFVALSWWVSRFICCFLLWFIPRLWLICFDRMCFSVFSLSAILAGLKYGVVVFFCHNDYCVPVEFFLIDIWFDGIS